MSAWRVGKHYGIHVYAGDRPVATFHDASDAAQAVQALTALAEVAARHQPYPLDDRTLCRHCGRVWPCADAVTAGETG